MTHKQQPFVRDYLKTANATQAYKIAYGVKDLNYAKLKALDMLCKHRGAYITPAEIIGDLAQRIINKSRTHEKNDQ
jgi:hypothetical protein